MVDIPYWGPVANLRSGLVVPLREGGRKDLNHDGDRVDDVLHVVDASTSRHLNLGLAVDNWSRWAADGDTMVVSIPESAQGEEDLDGDGLALSHVAFRIDLDREMRSGRR